MSSTAPTAAEPPGLRLLIDWANEQDDWVRAIASDVLSTRRELSAASVDAAYFMFLGEKGLSQEAPTSVAKIGQSALPQERAESFHIVRLSKVGGVNNLAAGQEIAFNPKFTLLFGENAAGKTGYVRVLKRVSSVRNADQILGNVYAALTAPPPSATIQYRFNDKDASIEW
jgi:hypothetical protein